jgi:polar amino acid transport system permease protein
MFNLSYAFSVLPSLLGGMLITVRSTLTGMLLAALLGLFVALARRSKVRGVSKVTGWLVEFVRSTPFLVQLYFIFFVLPNYGIRLTPFLAGLCALGIHYSAYTAEVYRAGIEAVPRGQWEAATALNFPILRIWSSIILPQAVPPMIPALGNYLIAMFKETAQLSAITVVEMLSVAKIQSSYSFRYLEPFTMVGLLYLALSYPSARIVHILEDRLGRQP